MKISRIISLMALAACAFTAHAEVIGEVSTTWRALGNDKIVVEAVNDDEVSGVTCHISYAKTGGVSGKLGFADDPSRFSIACRQTGPLVAKSPLPKQTEIAGFKRSAIFKEMKVVRMMDTKNNVMVYLVYATKLIDGSPFNSISSVPLMPWGTVTPQVTVK
jgi:CreA protein